MEFTELPVGARGEIEAPRGAGGGEHHVALFVGAHGDTLVGQIAQFEQGGHLGLFELADLFVEGANLVADGAHVGDFAVAELCVFELANLFGGGVAQGLEALALLEHGAAAFVVDEHGINEGGIHAGAGQGGFHCIWLLTEQTDV